MKKSLPLLTLCMSLCCVSCYDDSSILKRLDALEKNAIASINEQISAIKSSITSLETVDKELKATIQSLEAKDASQQGDIDKLKEADTSLETKISELKTYVDDEISSTEDWVNATFATIEKYNEIVGELTSLKELVGTNYTTLDKKIDNSIESIKSWVNEALKGYYTTTEVDELLKALKEDLDGLQNKLDNLLRDFVITFDDTEIGILAGGTTSVGYTITGATDKTTVKALGQNGWSAKVTPNGADKGTITVTAPNPMSNDEIIVLVYDGEFRTIMSTINFVTGVVTPSQTAVELEAEAGTIDITVTSNLNYKVSIPEDAKGWLSVVETKATKTETITFAYAEYTGGIRKAIVSFVDNGNNTISTTTFIQQGGALEITLTEAGTLLQSIGEDIYREIKGLIINGPINGTDVIYLNRMTNLTYLNLSNARIVEGGDAYRTNCYTKNDIISEKMFYDYGNHETPFHIVLPNNIEMIEHMAFYMSDVTEVEFPNTLKVIESSAFGSCLNLKSIKLPDSLEEINLAAFSNCVLIKQLTIPQNVKSIGSYAFDGFRDLEEIHLKAQPQTLTTIGNDIFRCFYNIYDKATLYIPKNSLEYYSKTDFGRFKNIVEE